MKLEKFNLIIFKILKNLFVLILVIGLLFTIKETLIYTDKVLAGNQLPIKEKNLITVVFDSIDYNKRSLIKVLNKGLPEVDNQVNEDFFNKNKLLVSTVKTFMEIDVSDPASIMSEQMPLLAVGIDEESPEDEENTGGQGEIILPPPPIPSNDDFEIPKIVTGDTLVGIYNTHTGETYEATDGVARYNGRKGGITLVTKSIAQNLEKKYGIKVYSTDKIHDKIYNRSYSTSKQTVKGILKNNPSLLFLLDVHRDAGLGDNKERAKELTTTTINGKKAAKIMFVIGTHHPNWGKNYVFMQQLINKTKKLYPQLLRGEGFREKRGPYNQHLFPHAILVEVGGAENATEEAVYSGELLADVISKVIQDMQKAKK